MLTLEQAVTIQILHQQGKSIKAISRELGCPEIPYVNIYGRRKHLSIGVQPRTSILDPYKPYLLKRKRSSS